MKSTPKEPLTAHDSRVGNCWSYYYQTISRLSTLKDADAQRLCCYQPFLNTYLALAYYFLSSHWGGVPFYIEKPSDDSGYNLPRTNEADLLTSLAAMVEEALPMLEENKNDAFTDANSVLFISKDVASVVLAHIYCNMNQYANALPLLEAVINNGYYSLVASDQLDFVNNSECIFGFYGDTKSGESCYPCLDYKDVLLTAAECQYHLGSTAKAEEYLNQLCFAKSFLAMDSSDILGTIASFRYKLQSVNYLGFLRRNSLGVSALGLKDAELYQLLWPIPQKEVDVNPNMTQNPGY